jgi:hypothetical protein
VSQETCPGWSKLALFARRSVAIGLAILARLFCCAAGTFFSQLDGRSEHELRRSLMRDRRSAGKSACATCCEAFLLLLEESIGARVATAETFLRGDFLRDAGLCGARGARCGKRRGIAAERLGEG